MFLCASPTLKIPRKFEYSEPPIVEPEKQNNTGGNTPDQCQGGKMAHYGTLKDTAFEAGEDIRGAHLYGSNEEKLGKIDDVIFDHSTGDIRYAVVDTGGWLHSKKFLVPVDGIRASAKNEDDFETNLSK